MKFLSFEEWMQSNPVPKPEPCPDCDGDGQHQCDCGNRHECGQCNGSGKAGSEADALLKHRERYEKEKRDIIAKLAAWGVPQ